MTDLEGRWNVWAAHPDNLARVWVVLSPHYASATVRQASLLCRVLLRTAPYSDDWTAYADGWAVRETKTGLVGLRGDMALAAQILDALAEALADGTAAPVIGGDGSRGYVLRPLVSGVGGEA